MVSAEIARAVAATFTDRANAARLAAATSAALGGPVPGDDALAAVDLPVQVETTGTGGDVSPAAYFGPSMGLLFLFLSVSAIARDLLTEKRIGLLDRVRAGPVGDAAILAGKGAGVVVVGVSSLLVIWAVTSLALGADWGDPLGVVLLIVAAALVVAGVAGLIAARGPHRAVGRLAGDGRGVRVRAAGRGVHPARQPARRAPAADPADADRPGTPRLRRPVPPQDAVEQADALLGQQVAGDGAHRQEQEEQAHRRAEVGRG